MILHQMLGKIPDETPTLVSFIMLLTYFIQPFPGDIIIIIGLMMGMVLIMKKMMWPIRVIFYEKIGNTYRRILTCGRRFNKKEDGVPLAKLEILGHVEAINCPANKFFDFTKKTITDLFSGEVIEFYKDGNNITPIEKKVEGTNITFMTERDKHEAILDIKKRRERIKKKDLASVLLKAMPWILVLISFGLMIWAVTEMEEMMTTTVPNEIRNAISEGWLDIKSAYVDIAGEISGAEITPAPPV